MDNYPHNTKGVLRNLLAHHFQQKDDWRVVLVEMIFITSLQNGTRTEYFVYTLSQQVLFQDNVTGGDRVSQGDSPDNAIFPAGE